MHYIGIQADVTARVEAEETLRRGQGELELRVAERTADLAAANAALLDAQYETLDRHARAAESRDDHTRRHTQRVGTLAELERQAGQQFDPQVIAAIRLLHACGLLVPLRSVREVQASSVLAPRV